MTRDQRSTQNDESPLEELKGELYAREEPPRPRRSQLHEHAREDMLRDWTHEHKHRTHMSRARKTGRFAKLFLLFAVIFFVVAAGIAAVVITRGGNVVSSKNVDISVTGPVTIDAGELLSLSVSVGNQNATVLETADLIVEFAPGTRSPEDVTKELPRVRESLGALRPGELVKKDVAGVVFGRAGDEEEIVVTVEYRIAGSNAVFVKEKAFTYVIGNTPLTVLIDAPSEINAGQEIGFEVTVVSNSTTPLEDMLFVIEYPFGFSFLEATPKPSQGNKTWDVGTLAPGAQKSFQIRGTLEAQDEEERTLRVTAGVGDANGVTVATPFLVETHTFAVKRPFVEVNIALNGSADNEVVVDNGRPVRVDITWRNNLTVPVADLAISTKLSGTALDRSAVAVERGFYRSSTNTVVWNRETNPELGTVEPGETGQLSLTVTPFDLTTRADIVNPEIILTTALSGKRLGDSGTAGDIQLAVGEHVARVNSAVSLGARAVHFEGPFSNSGPMPPEADKETSYTIIWSVTNSSSDVGDTTVSATLPSYVAWVGQVTPSDETVTFSSVGGQVVWDLGDVERSAGHTRAPREVAFQVLLTPSISQVGTSPVLLNETRLSGEDQFTGAMVGDVASPITTRLITDSSFLESQGRVVE